MDRFSFFFAFYGLILGLAVAELLGLRQEDRSPCCRRRQESHLPARQSHSYRPRL